MLAVNEKTSDSGAPVNARASSDIDHHVGQKLRKARKAMRMSQTDLGHLLGVSFQQVQKYEKGTNRIGSGRLWEMSRVLNVPVDYFFEGILDDDEQKPSVPWWVVDLAKQIDAISDPNVQKQIINLIEACSQKSAKAA